MGRGPHRREPHLNSSASTLNGKPALLKDLALPERVADYPKQRYMGSKHRLLSWIHSAPPTWVMRQAANGNPHTARVGGINQVQRERVGDEPEARRKATGP